MLESLSPRECAELEKAASRGERWPAVIRQVFLDGARLVLGIERAASEERIAAVTGLDRRVVGDAVRAAARWCAEHGLHLLGFPGPEPDGAWRHFMAVG